MSVKIYYDGDCYFCQHYTAYIKLRETFGDVELISLRDNKAALEAVLDKGFKPNKGFIVKHGSDWYFGAKAMAFLSNANQSTNWLYRALQWINQSTIISVILYQGLVVGRYLTLAVQGLGLINNQSDLSKPDFLQRLTRISLLLLNVLLLIDAYINGLGMLNIIGVILFATLYAYSIRSDKLVFRTHEWFHSQTVFFWLSLLFWSLFSTNLSEMISLRRMLFCASMLPFLGYLIDNYIAAKGSANRSTRLYLLFVFVFAFFPGLYLAPFYGGIASWYINIDKGKPFIASTYELENDKGDTFILNHALLEPSTQFGRLRTAYRRARGEDEYKQFLFENFKRRYPILQKGHLSHQRYLGTFAYPTHTLSDNNASSYTEAFSPNRIRRILHVIYTVNWDGTALKRREDSQLIVKHN